jgi:hypothetical protein
MMMRVMMRMMMMRRRRRKRRIMMTIRLVEDDEDKERCAAMLMQVRGAGFCRAGVGGGCVEMACRHDVDHHHDHKVDHDHDHNHSKNDDDDDDDVVAPQDMPVGQEATQLCQEVAAAINTLTRVIPDARARVS